MKKTMIFAGMLSIGYAYAQRGNVGINATSPNATLEVKVADANASNDTNQGVLIPKLSKTRVAAIADGKLVKGTLVFVEGTTYAGTNAKVADISADGFYYYNGTKWVRVEGSVLPSGNANGQVLKWNGSSWIVGTDNDTKYTAGTGLSLSGTTFSANPAGIALGGDVTGNANANKVTKIQGQPVDGVTVPTAGQVLKWIDNQWKPANDENTNTQYSAGAGLTLSGTQFSVRYGTTAGTAVQGNDSRVNNGQTAFSWGNHATAGYLKTLPIASATQLGGVKVGANLNITADGVLSATDTNTTYTAGTGLTLSGTTFSVNPAGIALGGDVTGNANANTVAKIQGRAVANTAPTNGQVLKWNQAEGVWKPENDANTNTTYAGSTSVVLSGNSFQRAALTGDVSSAQNNNTVTINTGAVTGAKIANGTITADKLAPGVIPTDTNTNIYTNDGTLSGARTVTMGTHNLLFAGTGKMGVGTTSPAAKFDVIGGIRSSKGEGVLDNSNVGYAFSEDGDTGMFAVGGHANLGSDLVLKNDNVTAVTIKTGTRNVGIHTNNPTERLEVNGSIKSSALSGTGNRNVVADSTGKLVIGQAATPIRTVTASTTIAATDDKGYVYVETSGATTITVPNTLPAGFSCVIIQQGDGQVTIAGSGVTLQTARGTKTRAKFSAVGVIKRTADTATITGDAVN